MANTTAPRRRAGPEQHALRRDILAAVRALHHENGNDAVTMRAVADAVGLSAMGLYRYYPNKGALLQGVWEEVLADALAAARAPLRAHDPAPTQLRAFYAAYIDHWRAQPQAWRMILDVQRSAADATVFAGGAAAEFRALAQSLVDACVPSVGAAARRRAHELCRCKVMGYLFLAVGIGAVPAGSTPLRDALLDDILRQLEAAEAQAAAPAAPAAARRPPRLTRTRSGRD